MQACSRRARSARRRSPRPSFRSVCTRRPVRLPEEPPPQRRSRPIDRRAFLDRMSLARSRWPGPDRGSCRLRLADPGSAQGLGPDPVDAEDRHPRHASDLADLQGQPGHRRRPDAGEGRDAPALQLRGLHRPRASSRRSRRSTRPTTSRSGSRRSTTLTRNPRTPTRHQRDRPQAARTGPPRRASPLEKR